MHVLAHPCREYTAPAYFHSLGYGVGAQSVNYCEKHFMWIEGWTEMEKASKQASLWMREKERETDCRAECSDFRPPSFLLWQENFSFWHPLS